MVSMVGRGGRWAGAVALTLGLVLALGAGAPTVALGAGEPEVVTAAADNLRTAWYPHEPSLTPSLLESGSFERVFTTPVEGQMYAQPLVADGTLLAATEKDWVYGLSPITGAVRWSKQLGNPLNASVLHCWPIEPYVGITGAPVIDAKTGVAYLASISYVSGDSGAVAWYMRAIELSTGAEEPGFPVEIGGEAQNLPGTSFVAERELQRPALLLMGGVVYAAFGGDHCDEPPYQGWVVGVSTAGQIKALWATATDGASIWQSGSGLVSEGPGRIVLATGNAEGGAPSPAAGPGDAPPADLGESVVRLQVQSNGTLQAADFFSPANNLFLDENDLDLASSGAMALPSEHFGTASIPHLLLQTSKTGELFLLNAEDLGGMGQGPGGGNAIVQELGPYGGVWDGLAAWPGGGGYVYVPAVSPPSSNNTESADHLRFFSYGVSPTGQPELSLAATSTELFAYGSGSPIVTSNGTESGSAILWIDRCPEPELACTQAELRAYEAVPEGGHLKLLWSSPIGFGPKFARPDAWEGHIYVGTRDEHVIGFGPLSSPTGTPLTVSVYGQGTVNSSPLGIYGCGPAGGAECTAKFEGEAILTATPGVGYAFAGWFGCKPTGAETCEVDVTAASEVTAVFVKEGEKGTNGTNGGGVTTRSFSGKANGCEEGGTEVEQTDGAKTYVCNGANGTNGSNGATGAQGPAGANGEKGAAGLAGLVGPLGAQGPLGPAGPAGGTGPPGKVWIVTCIEQSKRRKCTTRTVPGTTKFRVTGTGKVTQATLSRNGTLYAAGTARGTRGGGMSLRLLPVGELSPGHYTLTMISGAGRHERISSEPLTLR